MTSNHPPRSSFQSRDFQSPQYGHAMNDAHSYMRSLQDQQFSDPNVPRWSRDGAVVTNQHVNAHAFNSNAQSSKLGYPVNAATQNFPRPKSGTSFSPNDYPLTATSHARLGIPSRPPDIHIHPSLTYSTGQQRSVDDYPPPSDLEDGELSDGAELQRPTSHLSRRIESNMHPYMTYDGARSPPAHPDEISDTLHSSGFSQAPQKDRYSSPKYLRSSFQEHVQTDERPQKEIGKVEARSSRLHSANAQSGNQAMENGVVTLSVSSKPSLAESSLREAHDEAKRALDQLLVHRIGFSEIAEEGLDLELLKSLYDEVYKRVSSPKHPQPFAAFDDSRTGRSTASRLSESRNVRSTPTIIPVVPEHTPPFQDGPDLSGFSTLKRKRDEAKVPSRVEEVNNTKVNERANYKPQEDSIPPKKSILVDNREMSNGNEPLQQGNTGSKANVDSHLNNSRSALQSRVSKDVPNTAMHNTQKHAPFAAVNDLMTSSTLGAKPLSRKDFIAQKLAEKGARSVPASSEKPKKPIAVAAPEIPAPVSAIGDTTANSLDQDHSAAKAASQNNDILHPASTPDILSIDAAEAESNKKAATELARKKMEDLKNSTSVRGGVLRFINNTRTTPPDLHLPFSHNPTVSSAAELSGATDSGAMSQALSPSAFLPSSSSQAVFSIPGLFMSQSSSTMSPTQSMPQNSESEGRTVFKASSLPTSHAPSVTQSSATVLAQPAVAPIPTSTLGSVTPEKLTNLASELTVANRPRKRLKAADFIDYSAPSANKVRRTDQETQVIIEVSEDDADDETEVGEAVNEMDAMGSSIEAIDPAFFKSSAVSDRLNAGRSLPPSIEYPARPKAALTSSATASPSQQTSPTGKERQGLRTKEQEIKKIHLKIAELEQRIKAKQAASRAQSPGTPSKVTLLPKISATPSLKTTPRDRVEDSEISTHREGKDDEAILVSVQKAEAMIQKQLSPKREVEHNQESTTSKNRSKADSVTSEVTREEHLQQRKAELEMGIPKIDALLEKLSQRMQDLKKQEQETEFEIQKGLNGKRELLKQLRRVSFPGDLPSNVDGGHLSPKDGPLSPQDVTDTGLSPIEAADVIHQGQISNKTHTLTPSPKQSDAPTYLEQSIRVTGSEPHIENKTDAGPEGSIPDEELAEDIMDISGSERDDREDTEHTPLSSDGALAERASVDSEDVYEPPSTFDHISEKSIIPEDSEAVLTLADSNVNTKPVSIEDEQKALQIRGTLEHDQQSGAGEGSDSDYYEPPEPSIATEEILPTLGTTESVPKDLLESSETNDTDAAKSSSLLPISTETQATTMPSFSARPEEATSIPSSKEDSHFEPYESPLKLFHAYRYHPNFLSEVSDGYRSLTYSHKIVSEKPLCRYEVEGRCNDASCDNQHFRTMSLSDDMILVQMGAMPEGLTPEKRDAFVVGLRQIIQEIRGRKVKDFETVASEITAYRARFLDDRSRILPL